MVNENPNLSILSLAGPENLATLGVAVWIIYLLSLTSSLNPSTLQSSLCFSRATITSNDPSLGPSDTSKYSGAQVSMSLLSNLSHRVYPPPMRANDAVTTPMPFVIFSTSKLNIRPCSPICVFIGIWLERTGNFAFSNYIFSYLAHVLRNILNF